jgi:putative transposase
LRSRNRNNFEKHGEVFFVTSTVVGFIEIFKIDSLCEIMIEKLRFYQDRGDFILLAYVIMPDHFHLVINTKNDKTISECVGNLKRITSREITAALRKLNNWDFLAKLDRAAALEATHDSRIWKHRFDSLVILNEDTLRQKIEYIHNNPVRAGLATKPSDWFYSSARNYEGMDDVPIFVDTEWKCIDYGLKPSGKDS